MRALLILASVLALGGCETLAYYGQAADGQLSIAASARPVDQVLEDPGVDAGLKARLRAAVDLRDYAIRSLGLPDEGAYRSYAALDRPYAVWNVVAAPEFSLDPVQSCFPVAGCVAYRGYFTRETAQRYAAGLRAQGYDVVVYGVAAYSTLGWFDDPLLSTFIHDSDPDLARLLFHEMAHHVAYVKDDSTFNESFAVAVEHEGLRRWLRERGGAADAAAVAAAQSRREAFMRIVEDCRGRLRELYAQAMPAEETRARKREILAPLRPWLERLPGLDNAEPGNAFLAAYATYTQKLPAFERLLAESGGDLPRFYARVRELAAQSREARDAALR
ncbi:MAG TPA: aminopeptidase [Burkholderiales bacterium]|nr:aminopeptidase [Burkholderiales bacterium]